MEARRKGGGGTLQYFVTGSAENALGSTKDAVTTEKGPSHLQEGTDGVPWNVAASPNRSLGDGPHVPVRFWSNMRFPADRAQVRYESPNVDTSVFDPFVRVRGVDPNTKLL